MSAGDGGYEVERPGGQSNARIKFGLSGCHDTTLAGMLASLGALQDWPPFTSHIAVELFKSKEPSAIKVSSDASRAAASVPAKRSWWGQILTPFSPPATPGTPPAGIGRKSTEHLTAAEKAKLDGFYVRIRYNDRPITIPGCRLPGNHLDGDESIW
jgi:acid phosphatase